MEEKKLSSLQKKIISITMVVLLLAMVIGLNQFRLREAEDKVEESTEISMVEQLTNTEIVVDSTQEAKPAMTQDEMEEAIAKHKKEPTNVPVETNLTQPVVTGAEGSVIVGEATAGEEGETQRVNNSIIDFEGLWEINPDVYAWISVPGTVIEYPILQSATDNNYYLNHNIDGSFGYPSCIYTENMNSKEFSDPNTLIYGHNMKNGTMFTDIHKFKDKDFFKENDRIIITTPEKTLTYQIFANYTYDNRHLYHSFNFNDEAIYESYLQSIFDIRDMSANINQDIEITKEDKIITLVTCIGGKPDNRLLLQAVLLED